MAHRLRDGMASIQLNFTGPLEVDEADFGRKERHKRNGKNANLGRGLVDPHQSRQKHCTNMDNR